jgi:Na+/glutamate symporter
MAATTDITVQATLQADLDAAKAKEKEVNNSIKEPKKLLNAAKSSSGQGDVFRGIFFLLCFFTIGLVSNFKKLMEEGIGKLAAVYCVCLFGFIIWVGLFISWLFFHGVKPPIIS